MISLILETRARKLTFDTRQLTILFLLFWYKTTNPPLSTFLIQDNLPSSFYFFGGGSLGPPPYVFKDDSKSIGLRLFQVFWLTLAPNFRLKSRLLTYCPSPQPHCLNALFYLYQTKSISKPPSGHWIANSVK